MSRAYRISVKESLSRHVQVDDGVSSRLELLPILSKERTAELLAHQLEKKGFKRDGDSSIRVDADGIEVAVDLNTGEVTITATGHTELQLENERVGIAGDQNRTREEDKLRGQAKSALEAQASLEEERLRREVTEKLSGKLSSLRDELDGVVNKVTAEALKARARELGTVEEIHEDAATGSLTIKVRV